MTLDELAIKYGSDKSSLHHGYCKYYEKHLPENPKRILEIGVLRGASLRMWRDRYPDAEIHALDLFIEYSEPTDIEGVIYWKGNQTDQFILEQLARLEFDFCIEDGSHLSLHQIISFYSLIGSCDLWITEDLHSSKEEFYRGNLPYEATLLAMLKKNRLPFVSHLYEDKIAFVYPKSYTP